MILRTQTQWYPFPRTSLCPLITYPDKNKAKGNVRTRNMRTVAVNITASNFYGVYLRFSRRDGNESFRKHIFVFILREGRTYVGVSRENVNRRDGENVSWVILGARLNWELVLRWALLRVCFLWWIVLREFFRDELSCDSSFRDELYFEKRFQKERKQTP